MPPEHQETEAKFLIRQLSRVEARLREAGAKQVQARVYELNLRFDTPQGNLEQMGRLLRLRRDRAIRLTYKDNGRAESGMLSRREIEFVLDDFDAGRSLLEALGYAVVFSYEKYRTTYQLGNVEIMLDELPYGDFAELEGASEALRPTARKIGLDWQTAIPMSYYHLFQALRARRGLAFRDLIFDNFADARPQPGDLGVEPADE